MLGVCVLWRALQGGFSPAASGSPAASSGTRRSLLCLHSSYTSVQGSRLSPRSSGPAWAFWINCASSADRSCPRAPVRSFKKQLCAPQKSPSLCNGLFQTAAVWQRQTPNLYPTPGLVHAPLSCAMGLTVDPRKLAWTAGTIPQVAHL